MRVYGINYDVGFASGATTTHEPFDVDVVRHEMRIISEQLRCDAVRITGADPDRLETAARCAAEAGLAVWYCPFTNGLGAAQLLELLLDSAERAELLRAGGADVVFVAGSEISLFNDGFIAGDNHTQRLRLLADPQRRSTELPEVSRRVNQFLARAVAEIRVRFGGQVSYAALPFEGVDWSLFDIIATDAGYRDATTMSGFREGLRAQTAQGKPFAVTEFGCAAYRGAAELASRGDQIVEYDENGRAAKLIADVVPDEHEQAAYIRELLDIYAEEGVDAAFVYTFARRDLPSSTLPERDFDRASYAVVRILGSDATAATYQGLPWEPKAAFHAMAEYGHNRQQAVHPQRS